MTATGEAIAVIEAVLRQSVLPGLEVRIRPQTDFDLAVDIVDALEAAGFTISRVPNAGDLNT